MIMLMTINDKYLYFAAEPAEMGSVKSENCAHSAHMLFLLLVQSYQYKFWQTVAL